VDTGEGLDAAECIERVSFRGAVERDFFVNLPRPAYGLRLDPLDMEGEFRLQAFEVRPVSRLTLLAHALGAALQQCHCDGSTLRALRHGFGLLLRGRITHLKDLMLRHVNGHSALAPPPHDADGAYAAWQQQQAFRTADCDRMRAEISAMAAPPLLSVLLPVSDATEGDLRQAVKSVLCQVYPHWELWLVDEGSAVPQARALLGDYVRRDARIQLRSGVASGAGVAALRAALAVAAGDYLILLAPGDELAPHALCRMAQAVMGGPAPGMVYSDEDQITPEGRRVAPFFKPDWSPEYQLSYPYTGRLAAYRMALVRALGGFRAEFAPAHEYDLALRVAGATTSILHIPDVLYHVRAAPAVDPRGASAAEARRRAVASYLAATGRPGSVEPDPGSPTQRVRFVIAGQPTVSIIIPTAYRRLTSAGQSTTYLARCLATIRARTTYTRYEIVLLDNDDVPGNIQDQLTRWGVSRAAYYKPFNWAATMNAGAARASGMHLVFLDDDTEVLTPDWLECLLEYSQQSDIGVVGARLHFPDGRLQHTGVLVLAGTPGHPFYGQAGSHPGYFFSNLVPRNYRAVTGACLMTRAEVFREVGGFHETFAVNFNDIDYCLRVVKSGRRVVCNPRARLIHYETATKAAFCNTELTKFKERWAELEERDPFYNPNLSTSFHDFRIERGSGKQALRGM
jgi:GT2 family glycosyltransferase